MKTIKMYIDQFNRNNPGFIAELNEIDSYIDKKTHCSCYYIVITDTAHNIPGFYQFYSCKEFKQWIDGVILEG